MGTGWVASRNSGNDGASLSRCEAGFMLQDRKAGSCYRASVIGQFVYSVYSQILHALVDVHEFELRTCGGTEESYRVPRRCFLMSSNIASKITFLFCIQQLSHVQLFETPWIVACWVSLSFTISQSLLKLMSVKSVMPSNYLILCHALLLLPSIFPSIRIFSNELALHIKWPSIGASASVLPVNIQV